MTDLPLIVFAYSSAIQKYFSDFLCTNGAPMCARDLKLCSLVVTPAETNDRAGPYGLSLGFFSIFLHNVVDDKYMLITLTSLAALDFSPKSTFFFRFVIYINKTLSIPHTHTNASATESRFVVYCVTTQ